MALKLLQGPITFQPEPDDSDLSGVDVGFFDGRQSYWLEELGFK